MLSLLDEVNISQWNEIGEYSAELISMSINYGLDNTHDEEIMFYLNRIYGDRLPDMIKEYKQTKFESELVQDMDAIIHNSFVVPDEVEKEQEQVELTQEEQEKYKDLIEYIEAVKDNDSRTTKRHLLTQSMKHDPRQSNREEGIFKGWCAIHYAAYTNNVAMLGLVWNYERMAVTTEDTIIEAIGTGFGNNFFLSKGSTPLHVAILNDNKEAV